MKALNDISPSKQDKEKNEIVRKYWINHAATEYVDELGLFNLRMKQLENAEEILVGQIDKDTIKLSKARDPNDLITLLEADIYGITDEDVENYQIRPSIVVTETMQYSNEHGTNSTNQKSDGENLVKTTSCDELKSSQRSVPNEIAETYTNQYRKKAWKQRSVEIKSGPKVQVLVKRNVHALEKMLGKKFKKWNCTVRDATWEEPDYRLIVEFNDIERAEVAVINNSVVRAELVDFRYVMTQENSRVEH